jgi:NADH:ubiquinone oxidoreductase subunit E
VTAAEELASAVTDRAAEVRTRRVPGVEARAGKFPGPSLIPALNAIQARLGWLPREELQELSRDVRRPLYEIEGLISFYPHFRTEPPKTVELRVCHDLSCWLRGAEARIAALRERYGEDTETDLIEGSCIGRCDIAPAGTVNEAPVPLDDADAAVAAAREATARHGRNGHPSSHQTPPAPAASAPKSGAETAATILRQEGIYDVEIVEHDEVLEDHYDPIHKRLVLSRDNFRGTSTVAPGCGGARVRSCHPTQASLCAIAVADGLGRSDDVRQSDRALAAVAGDVHRFPQHWCGTDPCRECLGYLDAV